MSLIKTRLCCLMAAAAALWGAHAIHAKLTAARLQSGLTERLDTSGMSPGMALSTASLGAFRGMAANYLWIRAGQAKEQGRYYEYYRLAQWITRMQPRYTNATGHLAWEMSYNISVTTSDFEERWHWVNAGIHLIRDEALPQHQADPKLYHELAWIYFHKIGQNLDDANRTYRINLAREMSPIFGQYPDFAAYAHPHDRLALVELALAKRGVASLGKVLELTGITLTRLFDEAAAGRLPQAFEKAYPKPEQRQALLDFARLVRQDPFERATLLAVLGGALALDEAQLSAFDQELQQMPTRFPVTGQLSPALHELLRPMNPEARAQISGYLMNFLHGQAITRHLHMDLATIMEVEAAYGRFDWRMTYSHAIYWATKGRKAAGNVVDHNTQRMIANALRDCFFAGRLLYSREGETERFEWAPDLDKLEPMLREFRLNLEGPQAISTFRDAYPNLLDYVIFTLWSQGAEKRAETILQELRQYRNLPPGVTVRDYAIGQVNEAANSMSEEQVLMIIHNYIVQALTYASFGMDEQFELYYNQLARRTHENYMLQIRGTEKRRALPPFTQVAQQVLAQFERENPVMGRQLQEKVKGLR